MLAWVLSGPCHLGHMVPCRVAGVAVGGRDLNWERKECRPGVLCVAIASGRHLDRFFQDGEVVSVLILDFV